jgi:DNA polymerase V
MPTCFALIDCNNFFASCERLFRPDLADVPVIVLSSNDGCAVARSNEAKALGIKMGEPLHELKQRLQVIDGTTMRPLIRSSLPRVAAFSANFELYGDISKRVAAILARITPRLELYSIDEAFLDISQLDIPDYDVWGRALAAKVYREVGVPVSVGIASTKTLCKLAADYAKHHPECNGSHYIRIEATTPVRSMGASEKRAGVCGLSASVAMAILEEGCTPLESRTKLLTITPIQDIWGIGRRLAPRLRAEGIHTAADLAAMAPKRAQQIMGIQGRKTVAELNGISCIPLSSTHTPQQVISRGRQFGHDTNDFSTISAAIARMTSHACLALRHEGLLATRATVWLMTNRKKPGFTILHKDIHIYTPTADTGYITHQLVTMLEHEFDMRHAWHKAEVTLWGLVPNIGLQTDVFGLVNPAAYTHSTSLMATLDAVNQKHGKGTLRYATEDLSHAWYPRRAMQSPAHTSSWEDLPILTALVL